MFIKFRYDGKNRCGRVVGMTSSTATGNLLVHVVEDGLDYPKSFCAEYMDEVSQENRLVLVTSADLASLVCANVKVL